MTKNLIEEKLQEFDKKHPLVVKYKKYGMDIVDFDYMESQRQDLKNWPRQAFTDLLEARNSEVKAILESLKRTDETQMNDDHVWDEALDEAINRL